MALETASRSHPERLSPVLYLWLPLAVAVFLVIAAHADLRFYEIYIGSEIGVLEISQVLIPLISALVCLRILALPQANLIGIAQPVDQKGH